MNTSYSNTSPSTLQVKSTSCRFPEVKGFANCGCEYHLANRWEAELDEHFKQHFSRWVLPRDIAPTLLAMLVSIANRGKIVSGYVCEKKGLRYQIQRVDGTLPTPE